MRHSSGVTNSRRGPPRERNKRNSYSEQANEAAPVERESVEVERELPAEDNQSIERAEPRSRPPSPMFED